MAQLRDAQTSELILEGTPLEVALVADTFNAEDVLFDDVGASFDAAAVLQAHRATLETVPAGEVRDELVETERRAGDELAAEATAALEAARALIE